MTRSDEGVDCRHPDRLAVGQPVECVDEPVAGPYHLEPIGGEQAQEFLLGDLARRYQPHDALQPGPQAVTLHPLESLDMSGFSRDERPGQFGTHHRPFLGPDSRRHRVSFHYALRCCFVFA